MAGYPACTCTVQVCVSGVIQSNIEEAWSAVKAWGDAAWMGPAVLLVRTAVHEVHLGACARAGRMGPASCTGPYPLAARRAGRLRADHWRFAASELGARPRRGAADRL
jgi:hypothetical protein